MHCNDVPQIRLISIFLDAQPKIVWHQKCRYRVFQDYQQQWTEQWKKDQRGWVIRVNDYRLSRQRLLQFYLIKNAYLNNFRVKLLNISIRQNLAFWKEDFVYENTTFR